MSPYGIRALSRYHAEHPYVFKAGGKEYRVNYIPVESDSGMFGATPLARSGLDAGECSTDPCAAGLLPVSRR